jgi:replicative DNA helicase
MIDDGVPVVLYSAEMTWLDMSLRILSKRVSVTVRDIRRGNIPEKKMDLIVFEIEKINKLPFYVLDPKGMTTAELRADLVRLKAQHGIQVCIFDYLELLGDEYQGLRDWERAAKLVRKLVLMMTRLELKSLIIQKLNKDGWDGTPELKHFAGGSDLSYDVVSALVMVEHIPDEGEMSDGNMRTIINVKPQRLIQETRKACNLYKHPDYPIFSLAAIIPKKEYREYAR